VTRDGLLGRLMACGIAARRGFMAAHLEAAYSGVSRIELPTTEYLTRQTIILPLFHDLRENEQQRVVGVIRDCAAAKASGSRPSNS
jgi:dTDP-4-amino-4,6-dideoxygalactose transaminase